MTKVWDPFKALSLNENAIVAPFGQIDEDYIDEEFSG
jgi:hypothetical protein